MVSLYKIKKGSPIIEFIRQEIINQGYYTDEISIGCSVDNISFTNHDIYGHEWSGSQSRAPFINITIFFRPKPNCQKSPSYDNYRSSTGSSIHLKSFLLKYTQWQEITEWADPIKVKKSKCSYDSHNTRMRSFTVKMPDESKKYVDFPDSWEDFDSKEAEPILESMTISFYRAMAIDIIEGIVRNQTAYVYPFSYKFDIIDNSIVIKDIGYINNSIFGLVKDGLIQITDKAKDDLKFDVESMYDITNVKIKNLNN